MKQYPVSPSMTKAGVDELVKVFSRPFSREDLVDRIYWAMRIQKRKDRRDGTASY